MSEDFIKQALHYHEHPQPGKLSITATKSMANQRDLALAYSPGVAYPCTEIENNPELADKYTSRANLVAVITNGTAVLGLGDIGPLASKPVMEGKAVLFKKFAGVDVFDIEVNETDPDKFVEIVAGLEPTFGGINLEDIKAPECFEIEQKLKERLNIPVFHDDQHGTAIIASAALINALDLQGKTADEVRVVASGAGAAGMACLDIFIDLGVKRENIMVCDSKGVIYKGREGADRGRKAEFAVETDARTLEDAMTGADVFLGVSVGGLLSQDMVKSMAASPLILALANPTPEIMPDEAKAVRSDAIIATGRSDFPNQVNNVLCFPYIFKGALDVGATEINSEMKKACVTALAELAKYPPNEAVIKASGRQVSFGVDYVIPNPFDPRLISHLPVAVAQAAMKTGVARRPIADLEAYRRSLDILIDKSGMAMRPVYEAAKADPQRVVYAEGEDVRVLRAVNALVQDNLVKPILIGRKKRIEERIAENGLSLVEGKNISIIEQMNNPHYEACYKHYHQTCARKGIDPNIAKIHLNTRSTVLAAVLVELGIADTMIAGTLGLYQDHVENVLRVHGLHDDACVPAAMNMMITPKGTVFIADIGVNTNPNVDEIVNITEHCMTAVKKYGITPKVAMLSHSNFGSKQGDVDVDKMAKAAEILRAKYPHLQIEGEMQADSALSESTRNRAFPENVMTGTANILIMPNLDAANISYNIMKVVSDGVSVGPILMGQAKPSHVISRSSTMRRVFNMSLVAAVDAIEAKGS